jgi:hypothetical protein
VHFNQPFDRAQRHQNCEGLVKLLDDIERLSGERVMSYGLEAQGRQKLKGAAGKAVEPGGGTLSATKHFGM